MRPRPLQLRGDELPTTASTAPLVRGEGGLAATSWNVAMAAAAQLVREALDAGGPERIAVLGGARGTNEDAFAWAPLADALGTPHRDAQLGDGLPAEVLGLPRATIDETAAGGDDRPARARPQGGAAGPVPAPAPRRRAAQGQARSRSAPADTGLTPHAWRSVRVEAGATGAAAVGARRPRDRRPAARRAGRHRRRPGQPRRVDRRRGARALQDRARRLPGRQGAAGAAARQRRRRAAARPHAAADGGLDAAGILTAAADGRIDLLVLLGADPLADFPDADLARRALAGARRVIGVDTFLTDSSALADVVLRRRRVRREVRHDDEPRGPRHRRRPEGSRRRHGPPGLDDRRRAGRAARPRRRRRHADVGRRDHRRHRRHRAGVRRRHPGRAAHGAPTACSPCRPPAAPSSPRSPTRHRPHQLRLSARGVPQALRPGRRDGALAVAGPAGRRRARPTSTRSTSTASASPTAPRCASSAPKGTVVLPLAADAGVPRGSLRVPFNVAGAAIADIIDAAAPATDVRVERLVMLGRRSAARRRPAVDAAASSSLLKVARRLRHRPRRHDVHGLVRAQGHRRHAEPRRPEQGRPVRPAADARRRHEADLQGGLPARPGRPVRVPAGAVPRVRAGVPRVVGDPARRRLQRRQGRHRRRGSATRPGCSSPTRRSASCSCSRCRRSPSTASCSPAGRAARSTRCSARCGRRRR